MYKKLMFLVSLFLLLVLGSNVMAQLDPATIDTGHVYLFEDVIVTNVPDDSANENTGIIVGEPQVVDGLNGMALRFDGIDDGIDIPDSEFINVSSEPLQNRTVIVVFKCDDVSKQEKQVVFEEGGLTRGLTIYVFDGEVYVGGWNKADYEPQWNPGSWISAPINSNQWYVVALVIRDGTPAQEDDKFEMWMNGNLIGKAPGAEIWNHGNDNSIGYTNQNVVFHDGDGSGDGWFFAGAIDELWILNEALTETDLITWAGKVFPYASNPLPLDNSVCTNNWIKLSWIPGEHATFHNVYFSTELDAVTQRKVSALIATTDVPSVSVGLPGFIFPDGLQMGTTYYWCVDEVNDAEPDSPWQGEIWSFRIPDEPAVYLLITNGQLAPAFEHLVQRRTEQGFPGKLLTVEDICNNYPGLDEPEKIRNCIINHYVNYGTKYVTLGGDDKVVPVRYSGPDSNGMPVDLYYADADGSDWDINYNGIYGEVNEVSEIELTPEVHLGRIPLRTSTNATAYINKVVRYETTSPDGFANSMIFFGNGGIRTASQKSFLKHHDPTSRGEFRQMSYYYYFVQPHWQALPLHFLWDTYSSWDMEICGDYDLNRKHLIDKLNEGYHFAFNWSHGTPISWAVTQRSFMSKHALDLNNDIPGIVFSFSCSSAHFDDESICISEAFIQNPLGGAIAYFGHTRPAGGGFVDGEYLFPVMVRSTDRTTGEIITGILTTLSPYRISSPVQHYNYTLHGDSCIQLLGEESGRNLQLFQPKGCEVIERGSDFYIRWNAAGTGFSTDEKVRLEYSPNSGLTWHTIPGAHNLSYNGMSFLWWNCPLPAGSNYRIRVVSLSDPSITDMSGRDFTIGDLAILTVQSSPIKGFKLNLSGSKTDYFSEPTDFNITILKGESVSVSAPATAGDSSEFAFVRWKDESDNTVATTPDYTFIITQDNCG